MDHLSIFAQNVPNMILLVDNNDSFTYNIVELLRVVGGMTTVVRKSSELTCDEVEEYDHIIFSPGPGVPNDFPIMHEILQRYDSTKSILGICLGHQAIGHYYGGELGNLSNVAHGVETKIICDRSSLLFSGISEMIVGRYHSWVLDSVPDLLRITATDEQGMVMAVEHKSKRIYGVQFHPESYITRNGQEILHNFLYGVS